MTTTTRLPGYGHYTMQSSVKASILDFLGEHAEDYDVDGLVSAYRDEINDQLNGTTIVLRGDDFYADYPAPDDADELIKDAIESADLATLAPQYYES